MVSSIFYHIIFTPASLFLFFIGKPTTNHGILVLHAIWTDFLLICLLFLMYRLKKHVQLRHNEKKFSGIIEAGLCKPITRKIQNSDGTFVQKTIGYNFPKEKKFAGGVLLKFKESIATKSFIESKLDVISNAYNTKFTEFLEVKPMTFKFFEDRLPSIVSLPANPKFHSIYIGQDVTGKDIIIDTTKEFSIFAGASTGDGKTVTIKALAKSFLESIKYEADTVILDAKGLDYTDMVDNYGARLIEMNTEAGLREADEFLKDFLQKFNESKEILKKHNLVHYEDARKKGIAIPLKRTLIICDEAGRYLQPKESATDEIKELKKSIVNSITAMLATIRVSGCPIIVSTQRVTKDEMAIPYDNFLVQLFANISKEMDSKYRGGRFKDVQLGKGQWTIKNGSMEATRVRTAYLPEAFSKKSEPKKQEEKGQKEEKKQNGTELLDRGVKLENKVELDASEAPVVKIPKIVSDVPKIHPKNLDELPATDAQEGNAEVAGNNGLLRPEQDVQNPHLHEIIILSKEQPKKARLAKTHIFVKYRIGNEIKAALVPKNVDIEKFLKEKHHGK